MKTEIIEFKDTEIYCPIRDGEIYVAIKPVCEALGVDVNGQKQRIKRDQNLGQLGVLVHAVGRDEKSRKMFCLPHKYIYGWLFSIDVSQVKESARQRVIDYRNECYEVLYDHFWNNAKKYKQRDRHILALQDEIEAMTEERKLLGRKIKDHKSKIKEMLKSDINQLTLFD